MVAHLMERPKYCVTKVLPVDIDYSFKSLSSVLKLPIRSTTEQEEGVAFAGASVHLTTVEIDNLRIKGFRDFEIDHAIKKLQERTVSISHNMVLAELEQTGQSIKDELWTKVEGLIGQSAGILSKTELFHWLEERMRSHERSVLRHELDDHYASLWPSKATIVSLVGKWPKQYKSEAVAIKRMWPELTINGDINVDFSSATRELCTNCYSEDPDNEVLSYPTFFKLVKDIWFNAINCGHSGHLNRVTHLLIYIIKEIADNYFAYKESSREKRHESAIRNQFEFDVTAVNDIGALAFFLVTHPQMWKLKKEVVFQEMINRVLMCEVEELAGFYCQWLAASPDKKRGDADVIEQIARTIESQKLFAVTKAMYYLDAIAAYIEKNRSKYEKEKRVRQISHGNYFDDVTWQINGSMFPPAGSDKGVLKRIVTALNKVFTTPDYQHLFMGTPEYQSLQNRKKWQQVIGKIRKSNWDKKNAAARITIDATLRKVRAVRVIERRLSRLASQVMVDIAEQENKQRTMVKQQFYQTGFEPQIDPDDHSIFYPASYYLLRKQSFATLKQHKLDVESVIGTTIPFRASRAQIDQVLRCFHQLPLEESRYWQMSRDFAKCNVLPELVLDLSLSKPANSYQELQERQRKFIACKCLTCTICNVDAYLCRCASGVGKKLSAKLSFYKRQGLVNSVENNVRKYVAEKICTKSFDRYIPSEAKEQTDPPESFSGNAVSSVRPGNLKRKISEEQEEVISEEFMDCFSDVVSEDSDSSNSSDSVRWGSDSIKLNAHLASDGELCRKPHSRRPVLMVQHISHKIVCRVMRKMEIQGGDIKALWQAEADGESAARHFYQSVGVPKSVINSKNVAKWFSGHPVCKKKAVESLEKYPDIKHLVDKESLEFHPKSFKKIRCQVVYHDLDMFQEHLGRLGFNVKAPRLPINNSDCGLYLHKTFCLCCRINFGQPKELKEHLKVHHKKMEAAFARIKASPLSAPAGAGDNAGLSFDAENNSLAESRMRLQQRDLNVQMEILFKEMTA